MQDDTTCTAMIAKAQAETDQHLTSIKLQTIFLPLAYEVRGKVIFSINPTLWSQVLSRVSGPVQRSVWGPAEGYPNQDMIGVTPPRQDRGYPPDRSASDDTPHAPCAHVGLSCHLDASFFYHQSVTNFTLENFTE